MTNIALERPVAPHVNPMVVLRDGGDSASISSDVAKILLAQPDAHLSSCQLKISARPNRGAGSEFTYCLTSGNCVGSSRFWFDGRHVDVRVIPKIGNASVLRLIQELGLSGRQLDPDARYSIGNDDATGMLLELVVQRIDQLTARPLPRAYHEETSDESRCIRGRVDLRRYVSQNLPRMRHHRMPCRYFEIGANTPVNQILASTLERASRLLHLIAPERRDAVARAILRSQRELRGVDVSAQPLRLLDRLVYDRRTNYMKAVHELCRFLLNGSSITLDGSSTVFAHALFINMAELFEAFVMRAFVHAFGKRCVVKKRDLTRSIGMGGHRIVLDGLLDIFGKRYVVECKYVGTESDTWRGVGTYDYSNEHLYQSVAYANHVRIQADGVLLVYPFSSDAETIQFVAETPDFLGRTGQALDICVIRTSLTSSLLATSRGLTDLLQRLLTRSGLASTAR